MSTTEHQRDLSAHFIVLEVGHTELLVIVKVVRAMRTQKGEIAVWALLHTDLGECKEEDMESGRSPRDAHEESYGKPQGGEVKCIT